MINIKLKYIIILLLIICLIGICYFSYNRKPVNEHFYSVKPSNMNDVIIEIYYEDGCPITYQFMKGCCAELPNESDIEMSMSTTDYKLENYRVSTLYDLKNIYSQDGSSGNSFNQYTSLSKNSVADKKIYPTSKYLKNNSCHRLTDFQDEICKMENVPTIFILDMFLKVLNDKFLQVNINPKNDSIEKVVNEQKSKNLDQDDIKNLFKPQFKFTLKTSKENNKTLPYINMKIPFRKTETSVIETRNFEFTGNLNNIFNIVEFIYTNIKIVETEDTSQNNSIKYQSGDEEISLQLEKKTYSDPDRTNKNVIKDICVKLIKNGNENKNYQELYNTYIDKLEENKGDNFIGDIFIGHKNGKESHNDMIIRKFDPEINYLETRPLIMWDNLPMNINETTENSDYVKLLVLVKNMNLQEYYDYNEPSHLIYYYVWNVDKNIPGIQEMSKKEIEEQLQKNQNLHEIFNYRIFKNNDLQLYLTNEEKENDKFLEKNSMGGINRNVKLKFEIYPLTEQKNEELNELYEDTFTEKNYHHELLGYFYPQIDNELEEIKNDKFTKEYNLEYHLPNNLTKEHKLLEEYTKSSYKDLKLTAFSTPYISYLVNDSNYEKEIILPKKGYYEIFLTNHSNDSNREIIINGIDVYQFNTNYRIYRIPGKIYKFKIGFKGKIEKKEFLIIRESRYITEHLIWEEIIDKEKIDNIDNINITIKNDTIAVINYNEKFKPIFTFKSDQNLTNEGYTINQNNNYQIVYNNLESNQIKINLEADLQLYNGSVTFIPVNETINETTEDKIIYGKEDFFLIKGNEYYKPYRLSNKVIKNNCMDSSKNVDMNILPTLYYRKDQTSENLFLAIEAYYIDGKEKKYVYLEWDRKIESDTNIHEIQYNLFKNDLRKLITDNVPKEKYENYGNEDDESYTNKINGGEYITNNNLDFRESDFNEEVLCNIINIESITIMGDKEYEGEYTKNNNKYENEANKHFIAYNSKLSIWQLWKYIGDNKEYYNWVGNQKYSESLFYNSGVKWIMNNNKVKDFRSLPNMYNHNFEMTDDIKNQLQEETITFINTPTQSSTTCKGKHIKNVKIDNLYEYNKDSCNDLKDNIHYFKSTLFNLPEELDFKTLNPDGIEINTRYNEGTDEEPKIYYNLNLKIKFHIYKKDNLKVKNENFEKYNYNLSLLNQIKNPIIDENYDRLLSQYVKFNYLLNFANLESSSEIQIINDLDALIIKAQNKINLNEECSNDLKFLIIDQITSEILLNRGDLSKCSLDLDYDIIKKYIPMFEKSTDRTKTNIISDKNHIHKDFVELFNEYIDRNKIIHMNYSSFGSKNLKQNETEIDFKIPINKQCADIINSDTFISNDIDSRLKVKLLYLQFYQYKKPIEDFFKKYFVGEISPDKPLTYFSEFYTNKTLELHGKLKDENLLNVRKLFGLEELNGKHFDKIIDKRNYNTNKSIVLSIDKVGINIKEGYEKVKTFITNKDLNTDIKELYIGILSELNQIEYLKTLDPGEEVELNQCKDKCGDYITDSQKNEHTINKLRFRIYTNTVILYEMNKIFDFYFKKLLQDPSQINESHINLGETLVTESLKYFKLFKNLHNFENIIREKDVELKSKLLKLIEPETGSIIEQIYLIKLENIKFNARKEDNEEYKSEIDKIINSDTNFISKINEFNNKFDILKDKYELEQFTKEYNTGLNNHIKMIIGDFPVYQEKDTMNSEDMSEIFIKFKEYNKKYLNLEQKLKNIREEIYQKKIEGKKLNMTPEQIIDRYQKSIFDMYDFSKPQ